MTDDELRRRLGEVLAALPRPGSGLPYPVFDFIRQLVPTANVDLLIQNERRETLLAWRQDAFYEGWHIPGGIIRYREPFAQRIAEVARDELGATVRAEPAPCTVMEGLDDPRGHSVALLFRCALTSGPATPMAGPGRPEPGQLRWFRAMPDDMVPVQRPYGTWFAGAAG